MTVGSAGAIALLNFIPLENFAPKNTKCGAENLPFWVKLGTKLKF